MQTVHIRNCRLADFVNHPHLQTSGCVSHMPVSRIVISGRSTDTGFRYDSEQVLLRDAMHKRDLCRHAVSVHLSICPSPLWIVSKRLNISLIFFHHLVATPF